MEPGLVVLKIVIFLGGGLELQYLHLDLGRIK